MKNHQMDHLDQPLCNELPYWEFEAEPLPHIILSDGSVSTGLEILPLDVECYDEQRLNQLTLSLRAFANSLPDGLSCQFIMKTDNDFEERLSQHQGLATTTTGFLKDLDANRIAAINIQVANQEILRPRLFLFLKFDGIKPASAFSFKSPERFSKELENGYEGRLQALQQTQAGVQSTLSSMGFVSEVLSRDACLNVIYQSLNPKRSTEVGIGILSKTSIAISGESPRNQMVFGDLILDKEEFVLDRMRTRVLSLKTLPEFTFAGMMHSFMNLPFQFELVFNFRVCEQAQEIKSLEQKRRMAHSLAHSTSNRVTDLESESRLSQTTDLLRELIESGQKIFQAELLMILREPNTSDGQARLNLLTKDVLSKFKTLSGAEGIQETVGAWKIFKSQMPGAPTSQMIRGKRMKTNNMVDFLPIFGPSLGDELPVVLLKSRLGGLYSFNPNDPKLTNYNMLVTGSSGSGKSFANNFLMLQQVARGTKVYIIDIGGSYRKLTELLGGKYFEINLSEDYAINPFGTCTPGSMPSGEQVKALLAIIEQMVVDEGEKLQRFERVLLEEALLKIFEMAAIAGNEKNVRAPRLSDLADYCKKSKEEALQKIGKLMFPWIGNTPFGRMLDRDGSIGSDSPVVAFDLKGLSQYPDLQAVMILILTNYILEQVEKDRSVPKRVLLDEAWQFLKSPAAANFMEYAARTFRKTGSGITFITQGVEEISASGIGPAIINNTSCKLIMMQKGDTKLLADTLKLNSQELRLIQGLEQRKGLFSEGFFMEGDTRQVIRIQPSPLEYWISTSDSRDNNYLVKLQESGINLEAAIIKAAETAPFGVSQQREVTL